MESNRYEDELNQIYKEVLRIAETKKISLRDALLLYCAYQLAAIHAHIEGSVQRKPSKATP